MSKPANAIVQILLADAGVSALVNNRVYRNEAPQGVSAPYVIVEVENVDPYPSKDGSSAADDVFLNVISYSESQSQLDTLSEAVRSSLDEKTAGTYEEVTLQVLRFQSENDFDDEIENRKLWAVDQSYVMRVTR